MLLTTVVLGVFTLVGSGLIIATGHSNELLDPVVGGGGAVAAGGGAAALTGGRRTSMWWGTALIALGTIVIVALLGLAVFVAITGTGCETCGIVGRSALTIVAALAGCFAGFLLLQSGRRVRANARRLGA